MKLAYAHCKKDWIWLITPDIPFPLESIFAAEPYMEHYSCILSFRSEDNREIFRKLRSVVYNFLAKYLFGLRQQHVNSAFKLFRKELINSIELKSSGWFIDAEILSELNKKNVEYVEIPVPLIDRRGGKSTVKLSSAFPVLKEMWEYLKRFK